MPNRAAWVRIVDKHALKLGRSAIQVVIAAWSLYKAVKTLRSNWAKTRADIDFYP